MPFHQGVAVHYPQKNPQKHMLTILYPQITCALVRKIHYSEEESHVLIHPIN
jgi:hypothetical protein